MRLGTESTLGEPGLISVTLLSSLLDDWKEEAQQPQNPFVDFLTHGVVLSLYKEPSGSPWNSPSYWYLKHCSFIQAIFIDCLLYVRHCALVTY